MKSLVISIETKDACNGQPRRTHVDDSFFARFVIMTLVISVTGTFFGSEVV